MARYMILNIVDNGFTCHGMGDSKAQVLERIWREDSNCEF